MRLWRRSPGTIRIPDALADTRADPDTGEAYGSRWGLTEKTGAVHVWRSPVKMSMSTTLHLMKKI